MKIQLFLNVNYNLIYLKELLERCRLQEALELVGRLETAVQALDSDEEGPIPHQHLFDAIRNEQAAQFRIQLPNLLPNMFYVCEVSFD